MIELCPSNLYVEALTPYVTVLEIMPFKEMVKVKCGLMGEA